MKTSRIVLSGVFLGFIAIGIPRALAQQTMEFPRGQFVQQHIDSGLRGNPDAISKSVFQQLIHVPDAAWMRVYFAEAVLEPGSLVRMTSMLDNQVQTLDADGLAMWNSATAYFNGDQVMVELIASGASKANRIVVQQVLAELGAAMPITLCGLCAADDRTPSSVDYAGRLMPSGCSAAVYNQTSCLVSAGHCAPSSDVIQFRVPATLPNCNTQNPPVAEQFPITGSLFSNAGPGSDWAVLSTGVNSLGQTILDRYGEFRPVAPLVPGGGAVQVFGFGSSKFCTVSQTQQLSPGTITFVGGSSFSHTADTTGGNSGSGVFQNDFIIGIATHCPCQNTAQRIDHPPFVAARDTLCPTPRPRNDLCVNAKLVGMGSHNFTSEFAGTDGPAEPSACAEDGDDQIGSDVWFKFVSPCTGTATAGVCAAQFDTKMAAYIGCPTESGHSLACNDDFCGVGGQASQISFAVNQGVVYRVRVGGFNGATGSGVFTVSCTPAVCAADVTGDGQVNVADLLMVVNQWGPCVACAADVNDDGQVNVTDLLAVVNSWGACM